MYFTFTNPVDQELFITGEMYSERHYPRDSWCAPDNNVVLYFEKNGVPVEQYIPYKFVGWMGFGSIGKLTGKLPAGEYEFWIINQNAPDGPNDLSIQVSATKQLPEIVGL